MKPFLLSVVAALLTSVASADDLFLATVNATIVTNGPKIYGGSGFNNKLYIRLAAAAAGVPKDSVVLVYNVTADALQIVKRSDGTVLETILTFSGGTTIPNEADTLRVRYADAIFPRDTKPSGTVAGSIFIKRNGTEITKFAWRATVHGTAIFDPAGGLNYTGVYEGTFATGKRFVPGQ